MKKILNGRILINYILGFVALYITLITIYINNITSNDRINVNKEIPSIQLEDQFGKLSSYKNYTGKYVLIDFWFQGCKPCIEEMKYFPELLKKYKSELVIISVSIDSKKKTRALLQTKKKPFNFLISDNPNWIFQNDLMKKPNSYVKHLEITNYPTYLLFDKNGKFISSPLSGIAKIEKELGGFLNMDLTFKSKKKHLFKYIKSIILYTIIFYIIISLIAYFKKKKSNN